MNIGAFRKALLKIKKKDGGKVMDKIIDQLFQMEVQANKALSNVQQQKLALRETYDQKKADYRKQAQENYDQTLADIKTQTNDYRAKQLAAYQSSFTHKMEQIQQLVDHDQAAYLLDFKKQLTALGVNTNE